MHAMDQNTDLIQNIKQYCETHEEATLLEIQRFIKPDSEGNIPVHGADVNQADSEGDTPVHTAIRHALDPNNVEAATLAFPGGTHPELFHGIQLLKVLLANNGDICRQNSDGNNALHLLVSLAYESESDNSFKNQYDAAKNMAQFIFDEALFLSSAQLLSGKSLSKLCQPTSQQVLALKKYEILATALHQSNQQKLRPRELSDRLNYTSDPVIPHYNQFPSSDYIEKLEKTSRTAEVEKLKKLKEERIQSIQLQINAQIGQSSEKKSE